MTEEFRAEENNTESTLKMLTFSQISALSSLAAAQLGKLLREKRGIA